MIDAPAGSHAPPGRAADARPAGAPAVALEGLTKRYGRRTAVDALTLEIPSGVTVGLIGPNGAGKTTAMAMLLGLVRPTAGGGTVLGEPLGSPAAYLPRVGALIEYPAFYPGLSGRENLRLLATLGGHDAAGVDGLLDLVGLGDRGDDPFRRYSMGMKQRLGIAAALIGDPALLILDEPINGLDPAGIREMRGLIGRLARPDRTVLVSSHVLSELEQVCDWLVVLGNGRLVFDGPAGALAGDGQELILRPERHADLPRLGGIAAAAGHDAHTRGDAVVLRVARDHDGVAAALNRAAMDAGITLSEMRRSGGDLESRYLALVGEEAR